MIASDVRLGEGVTIYHPELVNLYGCEIGDGCKVGAFVAGVPARMVGNVRDREGGQPR